MSSPVNAEIKPVPYMIQTHREREESLCALTNPSTIPTINGLIEDLGLGQGAVVMDMGCGCGGVLPELAQQHPQIQFVGVDMSEGQLEVARTKTRDLHNVQWRQSNVYDLSELKAEYPEGFDLVLTRFMLMHVSDLSTAVKNLVSVKKEGGALCFSEPCEGFGLRVKKENGTEADPQVQKAVEAWQTMVEMQAKVQQATQAAADDAETLLRNELGLACEKSVSSASADTVETRRLFVIGAEMPQSVLPTQPKAVQDAFLGVFAKFGYSSLEEFASAVRGAMADFNHAFYFENFGHVVAK